MAYQSGPLRLKGTLGDLSFYHNRQYGYLVRQKGGPDKEQVANSPKFARTRENASEFSIAASAGKLIRQAVKSATGLKGNGTVSQRLTGLLIKMGKTDANNARGLRNPATVFDSLASRELLRSFAFYTASPLERSYCGQISSDISAGTFAFSESISSENLRAPKGATHVRIRAALVALDFGNNAYVVFKVPECIVALDNEATTLPVLTCEPDTTASGQRIGVLALEYLQEQNGELYVLAEGKCLGMV